MIALGMTYSLQRSESNPIKLPANCYSLLTNKVINSTIYPWLANHTGEPFAIWGTNIFSIIQCQVFLE